MNRLLMETLESSCQDIHMSRLNALFDVAQALQRSNNLSLSAMGRKLHSDTDIKHKIKKIDRLVGNKHLHNELAKLYEGLSEFVFTYIAQVKDVPLIIDLCFIKDDREIQMLSAEVATKGRTIPIYREVFKEGELAGRASHFLEKVKNLLPNDREVVVIMDAGFYEEWFKAIESFDWYWVCRIRSGKDIKLSHDGEWISIKEFIPQVKQKTKAYNDAILTKRHARGCRIITTRKKPKGRKVKVSRGKTTDKLASGSYRNAAKEPWILATNLPLSYKATNVVNYYSKRMQIEESFRDMKSPQFGLSARNVRTTSIHRWGVKMLLAAIVQISYWVLGVIGHSQGMQKYFQSNTVKDRKVFSYFTLGKFIIEYDVLKKIQYNKTTLSEIIQTELAREW